MSENNNLTNKKILIVEDDKIILDALIQKLKNEGAQVESSQDGEAGLSLAKTFNPDMIILDINLPKISGMEIMQIVRKELNEKVIIVLMTNLEPNDKILEGITQDNPAFYLIKANNSLDMIVDKIYEAFSINKNNQF